MTTASPAEAIPARPARWWLLVQPDETAEAVATAADATPEGFDERHPAHLMPYGRQWRSSATNRAAAPANPAAARLLAVLMRHPPQATDLRGAMLVGTWPDHRRGRRELADAARRAQITVLGTRREGTEPAAPPDRRLLGKSLSERELRCVEAVAEGLTFAAAGARLGIAAHRVRDDLQDAKAKLGARSTAHLVGLAVAAGLIRPASYPPAPTPPPRPTARGDAR